MVTPRSRGRSLTLWMQLPFNTQWTELKDFVRTVCEVDYVEVFNASTHAWVRIHGYEDYRKAFRKWTP